MQNSIKNDEPSLEQKVSALDINAKPFEPICFNPSDRTYIPPHRRQSGSSPTREDNNQDFESRYHSSSFSDSNSHSYGRNNSYSGSSRSYDRRRSDGYGGGFPRRGNSKFQKSQSVVAYSQHDTRFRSPHEIEEDWLAVKSRDLNYESTLFGKATTGIHFAKYEDIPIKITGSDPPTQIDQFENIQVSEVIRQNIELAQYQKPTPIQKAAIPTVLTRRDLMACAETGSGKTAAFLIPIIHSLIEGGPPSYPERAPPMMCFPMALILAPTRELAIQIFEEAKKFSYRTPIVPAVVYGGAEYFPQQCELRKKPNLVVATPGRLIDFVTSNQLGLDLIKYLVLDEADRMLDMGFEPQIRIIVEQNFMPQPGERNTLMFSATFPKDIQRLAQDFLKNYIFISIGKIGSTSENITQKLLWVNEKEKIDCLMELLGAMENKHLTLVFAETKRNVNDLGRFLHQRGYPVTTIHGDKAQPEREHALLMFRSGTYPILVATAVAARGLDIPNVRHVINFDLPSDYDEYVHRIGRTGRVGNLGLATSFFNEKNVNICVNLYHLLVETKQEVPMWLPDLAYQHQQIKHESKRHNQRGGYRSQNQFFFTSSGVDFRNAKEFEATQAHTGGYGAPSPSKIVSQTVGGYQAPRRSSSSRDSSVPRKSSYPSKYSQPPQLYNSQRSDSYVSNAGNDSSEWWD
ncbi:pL10 [Oopsacas minuta]|uniref:RNA helicase n=1 Tax=Oopsacas minuta TaxID=111878 RepID=A0AAV7JWB1_9METZ|nr:pL10 [Oopsacas minuta]